MRLDPHGTSDSPGKSSQADRWRAAEERFRLILESHGWKLKSVPRKSAYEADLLVRRGSISYAVELKAASEGRSDRLVPLFAQAALQVMRIERRNALPLAVVCAPRVPRAVAEQVLAFADRYRPDDLAVGVFDFHGLAVFRGAGLEQLNEQPSGAPRAVSPLRESRPLFSDLNQWMLKVLLANELPEHLLSAPRGHYRNASQLARAAGVSVMSAFRFVEQLRADGYLHESASSLQLVRRESLFNRWQAASDRAPRVMPMRFRLAGNGEEQLRKIVAADAPVWRCSLRPTRLSSASSRGFRRTSTSSVSSRRTLRRGGVFVRATPANRRTS